MKALSTTLLIVASFALGFTLGVDDAEKQIRSLKKCHTETVTSTALPGVKPGVYRVCVSAGDR